MPVRYGEKFNDPRQPVRQHVGSYRLAECEKLIKKDKTTDISGVGKDRTIPSLKFAGITLSGLNRNLVDDVSFRLEVPLNEGKSKFIGINKDAKIEIKRGTIATVSLLLSRDENDELALKSLHLSFSHSLCIKNPASSLEAKKNSTIGASIKDKFADLKIKDLHIEGLSKVFINGKIKALSFINKRLSREIDGVNIPNMDDLLLLAGLSVIPNKQADHQGIDGYKGQFNIKEALRRLGKISGCANFTATILGRRARISALRGDTFVTGPKRPLDIKLNGTVDLDRYGDLLIVVDEKKSKISCSLGTFSTRLEASFHHLLDDQQPSMDLTARIKGEGKELKAHTFVKQEVKHIFPRQRKLEEQAPIKTHERCEFNASMGLESYSIDATLSLSAKGKKLTDSATGQFNIKTDLNNPHVKTLDYGLVMNGRLSTEMAIDDFAYEKGTGIKNASGAMGFSLVPSKKTKAKFPELRSVDYRYAVKLKDSAGAEITPPGHGMTRFIRPIKNFEGHEERIDRAVLKYPLYPIGSSKYFAVIEKLTGAKLRRADAVKILVDGKTSMPERLKLIEEAKESICFQTLVFKDDASGWIMAKALVSAVRRGVKVFGVVDSLGNVESIRAFEHKHPIYEYLRNNGVELAIYNGFLETAIRSIFGLVKKHPHIFRINNPRSLSSAPDMIRFLKRIVDIANDESNAIPPSDRQSLKGAIHTMLNGKEGVDPEVLLSELTYMLEDKMIDLDETIALIKRIGKASYRAHEKFLIADGQHAILGGMNIADEYLLGGSDEMVTIRGKKQPAWRDTDVLLKGDIVADAYRGFRRNWLHLTKKKLDAGPKVSAVDLKSPHSDFRTSLIHHRPYEDGDHKVINFLLYNLRALKPMEKAWFETAYFLPRGVLRALQDELVRAAKRGVDVRILTNSETTSDFRPLVEASAFDERELLRAGARVFHRKDGRMVHSKVMVIGKELTMIGSWNMDNRSAAHDSEDVCCIYDEQKNREMSNTLEVDMFEQSQEISLKDMENRSLFQEIRSAKMLLMGELV